MKFLKKKKSEPVAYVVIDEANDKPAAKGIWFVMITLIIVLGIVYFLLFYSNIMSLFIRD